MEKISAVENKDRKWNEAESYYPVQLDVNGEAVWFMFTDSQLHVAKERASRNPEDIPTDDGVLGKLFKWLNQ